MFLEERVQVLQQQNEDLLAQIQINLSVSRYEKCPNSLRVRCLKGTVNLPPTPVLCPLQATVRGERQSPRLCGEGEHREEEAEPQQ